MSPSGGCQLAVTTEPGTPSLDAPGKTNFRVKVEAPSPSDKKIPEIAGIHQQMGGLLLL